MKHLSFHYHLKITMDAPVSGHQFTLRCTPRSDERQRITLLQHFVFPEDHLSRSEDQWGNELLYGGYHKEHTRFEAIVCGLADTGLAKGTKAEYGERNRVFSSATPLTQPDEALYGFAEKLRVHTGAPEEAAAVMLAVHDALSYEPGATSVATAAAEAFALRRGVCQDYAHVMLSVLRSLGIPARYVTGMLLGEGKSHAWVEVLHEGLWTGYDPTNCLVVSDQHIKLSHGRDAADCSINRGLFRGSARQSSEITVIVKEY